MKFYKGKKLIGEYLSGVLYKEASLSRHLMKKFDAWGIDSAMLHKLPEETVIVIKEIEEDKTYRATRKMYFDNQQYYHFKLPGTDFGTQMFLPRKFFTIEEPKQLSKEQIEENDYRMTQGLSPKYK